VQDADADAVRRAVADLARALVLAALAVAIFAAVRWLVTTL
jgi:hypothetical protein